MAQTLKLSVVVGTFVLAGAGLPLAQLQAQAQPKPPAGHAAKAPAQAPSCKLENDESPRGGRLDLTGSGFGQAPVVRIAGKVARQLQRQPDHLSVQVAADSNGGEVTVQAGGKTISCGTLTIIGKDR